MPTSSPNVAAEKPIRRWSSRIATSATGTVSSPRTKLTPRPRPMPGIAQTRNHPQPAVRTLRTVAPSRVHAMEPIAVVVRRGDVVEAVHRIHAVAVRDGELVEFAGDPQLVCHLRSSAKPLQALPLARAYEDLDARELAIASASHLARPEQLEAVRVLLARAEATEDD